MTAKSSDAQSTKTSGTQKPDLTSEGAPSKQKPDLTSVRTLVTSPSKIAKYVDLSIPAIQRWCRVNRIPGEHVIKVANFYNVEVRDLIPLTTSDTKNPVTYKLKTRDVLRHLIDAYRGVKTLKEACVEADITERAGKLIMINWGDNITTLFTTLEQLQDGRITTKEAAARLNMSPASVSGLRRKYGYQYPKREKKVEVKEPAYPLPDEQREIAAEMALWRENIIDIATRHNISVATAGRYFRKIVGMTVQKVSQWPDSFRSALSHEIRHQEKPFVKKLFAISMNMRLFLPKTRRVRPYSEEKVGEYTLKRLLVAVLLGETTLEDVALARGGEPTMPAALFTGDLRALGLTFDEAMAMSVSHQAAIADVLLSIESRKRRISVPEEPRKRKTKESDVNV